MYTGSSDPFTVDLDKESSPEFWSKNPETCIPEHINIVITESERVREMYPKSKLNVSYGRTPMESYDIYFKDEENDKPIFIYLHGGYWQRLNKEVSAYCVSPLAEKGYRVIVMDYNLCPKVNLETVVSQVKEGVKHILKYAKITNAKELTLCGHSAGGHMFASLLDSDIENKDLIKHFVLISGIYDLKEIWHTKALSDLSNTVNPLGLNDETSIKLSPMYFKNFIKYDAEVHLLTGKYEAPSFFGQAKVFGDILKKQNYTVHLHEFPEYDHFDIVHSMKDVNSDITKYLFYILKI
ncbi:AFMID.2 family protein [Megaselia abdita]